MPGLDGISGAHMMYVNGSMCQIKLWHDHGIKHSNYLFIKNGEIGNKKIRDLV